MEAMMTETAAGSLSIRACRLEDIKCVLELWRQAEATPGVTDTADDLRRAADDLRAIAYSPAHVLVAEVGGRLVGSVIGTFDGWRGNIYPPGRPPRPPPTGNRPALVARVSPSRPQIRPPLSAPKLGRGVDVHCYLLLPVPTSHQRF